jgi:hypothetical protein
VCESQGTPPPSLKRVKDNIIGREGWEEEGRGKR